MTHTLTIDIINDEALKLLKKMENKKLIRIRKEIAYSAKKVNPISKYKGAMQKQSLQEIDTQLIDIRSSWD